MKKTEKYALKEKTHGSPALWVWVWGLCEGFPPVFLWVWDSYGDEIKYPRQPWKGTGGDVPGRDIRRSDEKRERAVVQGEVKKMLFSLITARQEIYCVTERFFDLVC